MRFTLLSIAVVGFIPDSGQQPTAAARDSAFHLLNRLAYGPTPGDVDRVARIGVLRWVDQQLEMKPGSDAELVRREASFDLLRRSTDDLARDFRDARAARARAAQRRSPASAEMPPAAPNDDGARREFRALTAELPQIAVLRATVAEHQVVEVLADFWTNHFNVFYGKNLDQVYLPEYIERVIRPRALGRFPDLLVATATSPAMLVYLDNAQSVAPGSEPPGLRRLRETGRPGARLRQRQPRADSMMARVRERMPTGINENYARELLELHTLGVDGGYTQADIVDVARILTGWSIDRGVRRGGTPGGFVFNDWAHDRGRKVVLGTEFPAGRGQEEGRVLLDLLASHPSTLHFVSTKLCARFVNDDPPDGCIDDAVSTWKRTGGDIKEIVRTIVRSPDFWAPANRAAKVKTPLEFVVSAARAVAGQPDSGRALPAAIAKLGQPLFLQTAPTGYPETQADWVNSGALLNRMSFAVGLAAGRIQGIAVDLDRLAPPSTDPEILLVVIDREILGGRMSANTRAVIRREIAALSDPRAARNLAVGLALGGPEFQRQ